MSGLRSLPMRTVCACAVVLQAKHFCIYYFNRSLRPCVEKNYTYTSILYTDNVFIVLLVNILVVYLTTHLNAENIGYRFDGSYNVCQ